MHIGVILKSLEVESQAFADKNSHICHKKLKTSSFESKNNAYNEMKKFWRFCRSHKLEHIMHMMRAEK